MQRESTQELDLERDVVWEAPAPATPTRPTPPLQRKPHKPATGLRGRLQKLLDFALWERVALVRFGIGDGRPDRATFEAVAQLARQLGAAPNGPEELEVMRRNYGRVVEMITRNRNALDEVLAQLNRTLDAKPEGH